jgi:hypothetical protein
MRRWSQLVAGIAGALVLATAAGAAECPEGRGGLGVSRVVEVDAAGGPVFGSITKRSREKSFLGPKEVVLTFDDGPMAGVIATFTVDVVSNDSYIADPGRLIERTLAQLQAENGGIALFHDIKPQTARALPTLLAEMKSRGYRIVHMRAKAPFQADERYSGVMREHVAAKRPAAMRSLFAITEQPPAPAPAVLPPEQAAGAETADARDGGRAPPEPTRIARGDAAGAGAPAAREDAEAQPVLKPAKSRRAPANRNAGTQADAAERTTTDTAPRAAPAQVEVVAGAYGVAAKAPQKPRAPSAAERPAAGVPAKQPEILAGSYGGQPAPQAAPERVRAAPSERPWSDGFSERMRDAGN